MSDKNINSKISRRDFLRMAALTGGAAALAACAPQATQVATEMATEVAAPAGKKYEGVVLRGLGQGGVAYNPALVAFGQEFEAETGAK
jgi:nitrous oxide reductase